MYGERLVRDLQQRIAILKWAEGQDALMGDAAETATAPSRGTEATLLPRTAQPARLRPLPPVPFPS